MLYCDIIEKEYMDNETVDIIARAEDAPKINRIIEKSQMAAVKTEERAVQRPNAGRTEDALRSVKESEYSSPTRIGHDFDKHERPSLKEKIRKMNHKTAAKGRIEHGRER